MISRIEIRDLIISILALSFAFSLILFREEIFPGFRYSPKFLLASLLVVGLAFIMHEEIGHKIVAQRKGCWAEFRMWPAGLLLAVAMALLSKGSFVFAAPGAVLISPARRTRYGLAITLLSKEDMGKISAAGPAVNIILGASFGLIALLTGFALLKLAAQVNIWLALFNLIPFGLLDGAKILRWSVPVWLAFMALTVGLFISVIFV